jgi:hypothetical protein
MLAPCRLVRVYGLRRAALVALGALALVATPTTSRAQHEAASHCARAVPRAGDPAASDSTVVRSASSAVHCTPPGYWRNFAAGFATSILAHEAGHVAASYAQGGHPSFGFDRARPTVYSGFSATLQRHKQYVFSSAGLDVQAVLDEAILDVPHHHGASFERGILAGGIATAYFYATLGRTASNSDITYIARTSSLSKTQASLIYAGIATVHVLRIRRDPGYDAFFGDVFASPSPSGALNVGVTLHPRG